MTEHRSPIPARVYNAAVGGHVCGPEDIDFGQKVVHLVKYDKAGNEVSFESQVIQANKIYVIHDDFTLSSNVTIPANCVLEFEGGSINKNGYTIDYATGYDSCVICPTAEKLIASSCYTEGQFVRTLGYYNPNDGGGGLFKIADAIPSDYRLYYTLANGKYAVCMDNDIVLPRYGGVYVNQMVDNARPFMTPNNRKVIVLPSPNGNHPGCMSYNYPGVTKPEIYYWLVNAPIVIDKYWGDSDCYFSGGINVAPGVEHIEAVMKVSDGADKPENIYFPTYVQLGGRIISEQSKIVADHALLVEGVARLHFANLQAGYAKNSVTLGGTNNNNTIEFQAELMEIGAFTEKALNITGSLSKVVDIFTLRIQYGIGDNIRTGIYLNGDMTSSHINKLMMSAGSATIAFDMTYTGTGAATRMPVLSCLEASVSTVNFGSFTNGTYSIDVVRTSLTGDDVERSITLGDTTRFHCLDFRVVNDATQTHSAFKINTSASAGFFANTVYPSPEKNGRNIFINGVTTSGISTNLFPEGLYVDSNRNNALCISNGGQKVGEINTNGDFYSVSVPAGGTRTIDNIQNGSLFVYKLGGFYALCVIDETAADGVTKLGGADGGINRCTPSWSNSNNTLTLTNTSQANDYNVELRFIVKI